MTKKNQPLLFKGGRILDPLKNLDSYDYNLLIHENRGKLLTKEDSWPEEAKVFDLTGKWIVPGLMDMHVHLREPGQEYKETIYSGTRAAASGGFTSVACMPNTTPPNDSSAVTRFIIEKANEAGWCRVYPVAAITVGQQGKTITEFGDLITSGAIAFSDDGLPVRNASVMRLAMEYSKNFDALIISHAEDADLAVGGCMNEGRTSTLLGLKGIPWAAEDIAVFRDTALAELTDAKVHIAHISTKGAVEIIRQAKSRGVRITAETAPHYFTLTEEAVKGYNTSAKMNPPLRTEEDRQAIIKGLSDGTIDAIATDHAPHSDIEKNIEFAMAANGITGLETSVSLTLELVRNSKLEPLKMIKLMSLNPGRILGLEDCTLSDKGCADITVIDPELEFVVSRETIISKGINTPFYGKTLKGKAIMTVINGRIVYSY